MTKAPKAPRALNLPTSTRLLYYFTALYIAAVKQCSICKYLTTLRQSKAPLKHQSTTPILWALRWLLIVSSRVKSRIYAKTKILLNVPKQAKKAMFNFNRTMFLALNALIYNTLIYETALIVPLFVLEKVITN